MAVYFGVLAILTACMIIYNVKKAPEKLKKATFIISCLVLIIVSGLRYRVGTDYLSYVNLYDTNYANGEATLTNKPGLYLVGRIASLIYNDYSTWFFLMAIFTIGIYFYVIKKYSINITFSIFLFVFLGSWHGSFNVVKQYAATALILFGFPFLVKRDFIKWCFSCVLAYTFHESAIIMLPLFFLVSTNFNKWHVAIIALCAVAIIVGKDLVFEVMTFLKGHAGVDIDSDLNNTSVNALRIAVNCAPIAFYVLFCKKSDYRAEGMLGERKKHYMQLDPYFNVLFCLSLINALFSVATMTSIYLTRFVLFLDAFNILFIPYLIKGYDKKYRTTLMIIMLALYCVFWFFDVAKSPDTSIFMWIFER